MKGRAFRRRDDEGRRARRAGLRQGSRPLLAPSAVATRSTASKHSGRPPASEIIARDGDAQTGAAVFNQRQNRRDSARRLRRVGRIAPLHDIIDKSEIARRAHRCADVIEAGDKGKDTRAATSRPYVGLRP